MFLDYDSALIVEADTSAVAVGVVLSLKNKEHKNICLIQLFSVKMSTCKINCTIYDFGALTVWLFENIALIHFSIRFFSC